MKTEGAALGVYKTTLNTLGKQVEEHGNLASAMFAELEPRDGVEAMLIGETTATHVAMTSLMRAAFNMIHTGPERRTRRIPPRSHRPEPPEARKAPSSPGSRLLR